MGLQKKTKCEACEGRGWLLSWNVDRDVFEIQRCDTCWQFETDREAGEVAAPIISDALSVRSTFIRTIEEADLSRRRLKAQMEAARPFAEKDDDNTDGGRPERSGAGF